MSPEVPSLFTGALEGLCINEGKLLGIVEGCDEGIAEGALDGCKLGCDDGPPVSVGCTEGLRDTDGVNEGLGVGNTEGFYETV